MEGTIGIRHTDSVGCPMLYDLNYILILKEYLIGKAKKVSLYPNASERFYCEKHPWYQAHQENELPYALVPGLCVDLNLLKIYW